MYLTGSHHRWWRPRTALRTAGLLATLALALTACGTGGGSTASGTGSSGGQARIPIRIGLPLSNYWPAYVAREKHLYEKAGFAPHFVSFTTGAPLIAALKSGSIDAVFTGLATLFAVKQNVPLTYLYTPLNSSSQEGLIVPKDSPITSYRDLAKATTIAAPTATCAQISLVSAANKAGLDFRTLRTVNTKPNVMLPAFRSHQIDAAFIWGPWSLKLQQSGYRVASWDRDYQPHGGLCATNVAARPTYLTAHPSAGCRLVMVQDLAVRAAKRDPALAPGTLQKALGISPTLATQTYQTLKIPSLQSQLTPTSPWSLTAKDGGLASKLHAASAALAKAGVFDAPLTRSAIASHIDASPLRQYLQHHSCT